MPAGATYNCIATTTLGSDTASISFTSISGSYTDLVVIGSIGAVQDTSALVIQFNSDTGSNYSWTRVNGDGTSAASARGTNTTYISGFEIGAQSDPNALIVHIMNYSNTTTNKTALVRSNYSGRHTSAVAGLWRSTSAITSILVSPSAGNLKANTTLSLYGIAAA